MSFYNENMSDYEDYNDVFSSSDDEGDFCKFISHTCKDNVHFIMIDITCYEEKNSELCYHDVILHFINGDICQEHMNIHKLKKLFIDHDLINEITDNELFQHILA